MTRPAALFALMVAWTALAMARPAWSCGCGALVTADSDGMRVDEETSIVRYDDRTRTEQILMRLSVRSKARDAAWLFPTPSVAKVRLGDRGWFRELDALTRPKVIKRHRWWTGPDDGDGGGTAGAPGASGRDGQAVRVLGEQRLGPFEVATLAAGDSRALARWLAGHGYELSPKLAGALEPYVARGWSYVAVRLVPGAGGSLTGLLDPLHVTFRSDQLIYPMRLSRLAKSSQSVHLYVLGAHRVGQQGPRGGAFHVAFAGWVEPAQVTSPGLREFMDGRMFLTEVQNRFLDPAEIDDDFHYTYTADTPYREIDYQAEYVAVLGVPAGWVLLFGGLLMAGGATLGGVLVARRLINTRRRAAG